MKDWFFELRDSASAPDYEARLTFASTGAMTLREAVAGLGLTEFRRLAGEGYDVYCCQDHVQNFRRGKHNSVINVIDVYDAEIHFFRAAGGHGQLAFTSDEMRIFEWALSSPDVRISQWEIRNGGDGVAGDCVRTGDSKEALAAYLRDVR